MGFDEPSSDVMQRGRRPPLSGPPKDALPQTSATELAGAAWTGLEVASYRMLPHEYSPACHTGQKSQGGRNAHPHLHRHDCSLELVALTDEIHQRAVG